MRIKKNTVQEVMDCLSEVAPLGYQEDYDNAGLLTGNANLEVENILLALDCTEAVIDDAIAKKCNVIVCHHPIIFKGLKSLTGSNYVERTVIKAIKNDMAIIAWHTNLDNVLKQGVSEKMAHKLGLKNLRILQPKANLLFKLVTYIPEAYFTSVTEALFATGAGKIGEYAECGFSVQGEGTFTPSANANPTVGKPLQKETTTELRFETMVPDHLLQTVIAALQFAHPYEEVAYEVYPLKNIHQEIGSGVIGNFDNSIPKEDFLAHLKKQFGLQTFKHTHCNNYLIKTVAVCGGAGSFLIHTAKAQKADAYITSDIKYHEFFDADNQLLLCDIGHYESEIATLEIFNDVLSKKFVNFATLFTDTNTNPVIYYK